ncbi:MAG TPA: hybrid sensor histidine kinase/response regulator [Alphaproteobacteria bacterium]|nr:hybrid sensor histidine kinase/response regulator [Alphaproteobacteria bacterium]
MSDTTPARELADAFAALEQAERANRAKSRFLAAASHDLRQPLQALKLLNAALREYLLTDDIALNILNDSERALEVMDRMLNSLLEISKIDSGAIIPELADFRIGDMFKDLRGDFLLLTKQKNLGFRIVSSSAVVRTDRALLDSILRNLLGNAVRYTSHGRILLGCRKQGESLRIEVRDTGAGIAPGELDRIFDEFYQIGAPDRDSSQGLGLGLSIVRAYANLLGHPLKVQSWPGRGSVFSILIPSGDLAAAEIGRRDDAGAGTGWKQQGHRILLIEDDALSLKAMQAQLTAWGMQVIGARSGDEAVEMLQQNGFTPELIITDYRLQKGETGVTALARLRPLLGDMIPVIFVTGDGLGKVRSEISPQYTHLLQKPVAPGKLRVLIRNLLSGYTSGPTP